MIKILDFYRINERITKDGIEIYPDFRVCRSEDLMIRGKNFYAIWDEEKGLWSTDEYDVQRLVDKDLRKRKKELEVKYPHVRALYMRDFSTQIWAQFLKYTKSLSDSSHQLDERVIFSDTVVTKEDYASKRLPYSMAPGDISSYEEVVSTLFDPEERQKVEWSIGSIISGDSKDIQKFLVFYGAMGTGKSTYIGIMERLFPGYTTTFDARSLVGNNNSFATDVFRGNPLLAIQHDGDLSKIEDNTKLNSIVSHEYMTMNEKFKPSYISKVNAFLIMGSNRPVKITDSKSGIIRRLIDVQPSNRLIPSKRYHILMSLIEFELGAIAHHCHEVYKSMGRDYYSNYRAVEMMLQTDVFLNYVESAFDIFKRQDGVSLNQAYELYKNYCQESLVEYKLAKYKFREELKNYFRGFEERSQLEDGTRVRSWYSGFITDKFNIPEEPETPMSWVMDQEESKIDHVLKDCPAQYGVEDHMGRIVPGKKWADVTTVLSNLETFKVHYLIPPDNHIVVDFDIKNDKGEKDSKLNLEAASKWPPTYAEFSQGGGGIHLHYIYTGDVDTLSRIFAEGIEIKVFKGGSSLRRRHSRSNGLDITTISGGLPMKEKRMLSEAMMNERYIRSVIAKNLRKEVHPGTKPSIDFIHKILEDAYNTPGLEYNVEDMLPDIITFANRSTNQATYCLRLVNQMKLASKEMEAKTTATDERLVIFDVEVFPNLFVVSWMYEGNRDPNNVVTMINPNPEQIQELLGMKLVGFYNKLYDNHILYAASLGYSNIELYKLSKKLTSGEKAYFASAYSISYMDLYAVVSKKQSLKKYQIEYGLGHKELGLPWDEPVDPSMFEEVGKYCVNDVITTGMVLEIRHSDVDSHRILTMLSGLTMNHSVNQHTARIIFGENKTPQDQFIYTDLSEEFPGYTFDRGKSVYRGEEVGEGGYVYSEPGMYKDVAVLDIASMHPTTIERLEMFGPYTHRFSDLKNARLAIKHGQYEDVQKLKLFQDLDMSGLLGSEEDAENLSYALKIVINSVYGLTASKFETPFRDHRNIDNIVAKRGALYMVDLKHYVQELGYQVIHIKTDSIKIPGATKEIIDLVMEHGHSYGYTFEHEYTYEKMCLVNDAVFAAYAVKGRKPAHWQFVGAEFAHPVVSKTLFTKEPITFEDMAETKSVTSVMYIDYANQYPMALVPEGEERYKFIGKVGSFVPVDSENGGSLMRFKDGKYYTVTGTKGYFWAEADLVKTLGLEEHIDEDYYDKIVESAKRTISKFGDVEEFTKTPGGN